MSSTGRTNSRKPGNRGSYWSAISTHRLGLVRCPLHPAARSGSPVDDGPVLVAAQLPQQRELVAEVPGDVGLEQRVGAAGRAPVDPVDAVDPDEDRLSRLGDDELGKEAPDREAVLALHALVVLEGLAVVPPRLVQPAGPQPAVLVAHEPNLGAVDFLESQQVVERQQCSSPKKSDCPPANHVAVARLHATTDLKRHRCLNDDWSARPAMFVRPRICRQRRHSPEGPAGDSHSS